MNDQVNLTDLEYNELESFVTETLGQPKFRAKQIFGWIHGGPAKDGGIRPCVRSWQNAPRLCSLRFCANRFPSWTARASSCLGSRTEMR